MHAILHVGLADGHDAFEACGAEGAELDFARASAGGEHLQGGRGGLRALGFDDERHLTADRRERGRRRGLDDGDLQRCGALEVRKRHRGTREEAGEMQHRHEAQPHDDRDDAECGEKPRLQRASGQALIPIDAFDGFRDIVLELLAEFRAVLHLAIRGKLDRSKQALAQRRLGSLDELRRAFLALRLRDETQGDLPRGDDGGDVSRERDPRAHDVRHEPGKIEQRNDRDGRERDGEGAEQAAGAEELGTAGAEGIERGEGGGAEGEGHERRDYGLKGGLKGSFIVYL